MKLSDDGACRQCNDAKTICGPTLTDISERDTVFWVDCVLSLSSDKLVQFEITRLKVQFSTL
jgi:hypothetical protein